MMSPNPFGYDENPEKFKPRSVRPRWLTPLLAGILIVSLVLPLFFSPAGMTRNLYILGFMLCVIIFVVYRVFFSMLFGERAARREFTLPKPPPPPRQPDDAPARKRERVRMADGTWLEIIDEE